MPELRVTSNEMEFFVKLFSITTHAISNSAIFDIQQSNMHICHLLILCKEKITIRESQPIRNLKKNLTVS